jgi:Superinfection immunity protein
VSVTLANSPAFWIALIGALAVLYLLPILIAVIRHAEDLWLVVLLTALPTGIGWLAALVMSCMMPRREPPAPYYREEQGR